MSSKTSQKMSYSTALARNTKLPIKEISIEKWLKHYGLEEFYNTIFTTDKSYINGLLSYGKFTNLLISIKTNVQLIFTFANHVHFGETIAPFVKLITSKMFNEGKITKTKLDSAFYLKELINNFKLLKSQELEYKAYFSLAGLNPTKEHFDKTVVNSRLLNFLDHKLSDATIMFNIKGTLQILDFDDFLHSTASLFNLLLSIPLELLQKFVLHSTHKITNIKNGATKTMTDAEFNAFIDGNEVLEFFESCDNLFDIKTIKRNLQEKFDANSFIEAHRIELISSLIQPRTLVPESISDQIYNTIFPNSDNIYINKQFQLIDDNIPATPQTLKLVKENKVRVFFIQGHGTSCAFKKYDSQPRVDFDSVFNQVKLELELQSLVLEHVPDGKYNSSVYDGPGQFRSYKLERCMVASAQPIGRLSILEYIDTFIDLFSFKHREIFIRGLLDAVPNTDGFRPQLDILDTIFTMLFHFNFLKNLKQGYNDVELEKEFTKFLKTYKFDGVARGSLQYPKTVITSQNLINLIKYNHRYPPVDSVYTFTHNSHFLEPMYGIFELDPNHSSDLKDLNARIRTVQKGPVDMKMGLMLEHLYKFRGDVSPNIEAILKYNRELKKRNKYDNCSLSEIIEIIYTVGNIKSDEFVLIISNSCRGLYDDSKPIRGYQQTLKLNTSENFAKYQQSQIQSLRINSVEGSSVVRPSDTVAGKSKRTKRTKLSRKRTKRTKRTKLSRKRTKRSSRKYRNKLHHLI